MFINLTPPAGRLDILSPGELIHDNTEWVVGYREVDSNNKVNCWNFPMYFLRHKSLILLDFLTFWGFSARWGNNFNTLKLFDSSLVAITRASYYY